jgi:hypothetical protein
MKLGAVALPVVLLCACGDYYVMPGWLQGPDDAGTNGPSGGGEGGGAGGSGALGTAADAPSPCNPRPAGTIFCDDFDAVGERLTDQWDDVLPKYLGIESTEARSRPSALAVGFDDFTENDEAYVSRSLTVPTTMTDVTVAMDLRIDDASAAVPVVVWIGATYHVDLALNGNGLVERLPVSSQVHAMAADAIPSGTWFRLELHFHRRTNTVDVLVEGVPVLTGTQLQLSTNLTSVTMWRLQLGAADTRAGARLHAQLDGVLVAPL